MIILWYISIIVSSEIKFDQVWSSLIKKNENLMIYFNGYFIRNWKCGKCGKFWGKDYKSGKKHLRTFARTRAKKWSILGTLWLAWEMSMTGFRCIKNKYCLVACDTGLGEKSQLWIILAGVWAMAFQWQSGQKLRPV